MIRKKRYLLPLLTGWLMAGAAAGANIEQQRLAYKAAYAAASRGQETIFRTLAKPLESYPLYPYLLYAELVQRIDRASDQEVLEFLEQYATVPVAQRLRARWLQALGRREAWGTLLAHYDPSLADAELRCYQLQALIDAGQAVPFDSANQDLWFHGQSRPQACDPVFEYWDDGGLLEEHAHLERAKLAVRSGQYGLALHLARSLPSEGRRAVRDWIDLYKDPRDRLVHVRQLRAPGDDRQMVAEAMVRLSRSNNDVAYGIWPRVSDFFAAHEDLAQWVQRQMALYSATDYGDDAASRLDALPAESVDQQILEWRARVALASGEWPAVLAAIDRMGADFSERAQWRYWRARALEAQGDSAAARPLFVQLAREPHYYGFLSADRLQAPYALCQSDDFPDGSAAAAVAQDPRIGRALELSAVRQTTHARREWRAAMQDFSRQQALAAALLAAAGGWYHQVIVTLADIDELQFYEQRFPLAWQQEVSHHAAQRRLPVTLVYGIMRSESALAPDAISSADARGLMQLTLDTARTVARRYRLSAPDAWSLLQPARNIELGTAYLDQLFERFGHPLKVIAAYNAGPTPVERWSAEGRLPNAPARWIETLPYHETRDYIPRVLTFAAIYDWQLTGGMQRISSMMAPLDEQPGRPDPAVERVQPVCPAGGST